VKGKNISLRQVLKSETLYEVPIYQRPYQWNAERWQALVSDFYQATLLGEGDPAHWLGILLVSQVESVAVPGEKITQHFVIVDGQQRLVTCMIWLSALRDHNVVDDSNPNLNFSGLATFKVQESDQRPFNLVVDGLTTAHELNDFIDHQIVQAYIYFRFILWGGMTLVAEEQPNSYPSNFIFGDGESSNEDLWKKFIERQGYSNVSVNSMDITKLLTATLDQMRIFSLTHEPSKDEEQAVIFDTLNGMRQELEPLDHIRNSIFVRMPTLGHEVFEKSWLGAETELTKTKKRGVAPGKAFIYDYLISQGQKKKQGSINATRGAVHFARMTRNMSEARLQELLEESVIPGMRLWPVVISKASNVKVKNRDITFSDKVLQHIESIQNLSSGPPNPVILHFLQKYVKDSDEQYLLEALALVESCLARYFLANQPLPLLRSKIMNLMGDLACSYDLELFRNLLKKELWFSDIDVRLGASSVDFGLNYKPAQLGAIFRGVERYLSGDGSLWFKMGKASNLYSIEHIFPQKPALWTSDLKAWRVPPEEMENRMHKLGNLTVVTSKHNKAVGNKRFEEKRKYPTIPGNMAPLSINSDWLDSKKTKWTPKLIDERTRILVDAALRKWPDF